MGGQHRQRFLKPAKEYGKLDLLSVEWVPPRDEKPGKLVSVGTPALEREAVRRVVRGLPHDGR